ncbi:translesion error-prone DNA polymerase V autoproteolytic subunit [Methylobacterium sp. WL9]|uniref:LexA family protein n=1 Tax=Methylobacterium sp. WL9 TaxID=2603898 RepID=UPI0011CA2933|nr:translesion error-prone DNA polymerase V autoproteolytic subunit [Methylobacterium sp. WL9]TXN21294.1 translesion error-prone DNA polymerase V autoproteolytic subunit [Methylobacterium sp. WL9]
MGPAVCAGFPSPADDFLEEALGLPRWLVPNPPATFLWRVSGSSVIGAGIHDGDIVIVDRSAEPAHDDIVLAIVEGVASLKRYRINGNRATLSFDSPDLPATPIEDIAEATIWGVVTTSLRLHRPLVRGRR